MHNTDSVASVIAGRWMLASVHSLLIWSPDSLVLCFYLCLWMTGLFVLVAFGPWEITNIPQDWHCICPLDCIVATVP